MIFSLGWLIAVITFPGVIMYQIARQLFCRWTRVAVLDVCYFRSGDPAGYVVHEPPRTARHWLWIGIGPFLVNTFVGAVIGAPAAIPILRFGGVGGGNALDIVQLWLGVSIAMHAFPSSDDAAAIWRAAHDDTIRPGARAVALPIAGLITLGALGSRFRLDVLYGIAVAALIPNLIVALFA